MHSFFLNICHAVCCLTTFRLVVLVVQFLMSTIPRAAISRAAVYISCCNAFCRKIIYFRVTLPQQAAGRKQKNRYQAAVAAAAAAAVAGYQHFLS